MGGTEAWDAGRGPHTEDGEGAGPFGESVPLASRSLPMGG